jgi:hypothetical protein
MQQKKSAVGVWVPILKIHFLYLQDELANISLQIMIVCFVSFAVTNWIDLFIREAYKEEILKSIRYCQAVH